MNISKHYSNTYAVLHDSNVWREVGICTSELYTTNLSSPVDVLVVRLRTLERMPTIAETTG